MPSSAVMKGDVHRHVEAVFHYLDNACTAEQLNFSRTLASPNGYGDIDDPRTVTVQDVACRENEFSLETSGFCYESHASPLADSIMGMCDGDIEKLYYPETEALIQKITGASSVHMFNHLRRISHGKNPQPLGGKDKIHHQAYKVHVDQSWKQVREHVRHVLDIQGEGLNEKMKQRFQIINTWRPLRTVRKDPLAITDIRTQSPNDLVRIDVVLADGIKTSNLAVRYNERHAWYYKHAQRPDELLIFKQFDSADRKCLGQLLHSAFADVEYDDGDPRWSIETRALVFYDDQRGIDPADVEDRGFGAEVKRGD